MFKIKVVNLKGSDEVSCENEISILLASRSTKIELTHRCGGHARCGTCLVTIHTEGTDKNLWSFPGAEKRMRSTIPLGRIGEVRDISQAALFLSSPQASWISGADLDVDGAQWLNGGVFGWDPNDLPGPMLALMKAMRGSKT